MEEIAVTALSGGEAIEEAFPAVSTRDAQCRRPDRPRLRAGSAWAAGLRALPQRCRRQFPARRMQARTSLLGEEVVREQLEPVAGARPVAGTVPATAWAKVWAAVAGSPGWSSPEGELKFPRRDSAAVAGLAVSFALQAWPQRQRAWRTRIGRFMYDSCCGRQVSAGRNLPFPIQTRFEGKGCNARLCRAPLRQLAHSQAKWLEDSTVLAKGRWASEWARIEIVNP